MGVTNSIIGLANFGREVKVDEIKKVRIELYLSLDLLI